MTVKPKDLGLPPKFEDFRAEQWSAIEEVAASTARVVLLQAPTGVGKTVVMAALQKYLQSRMLYTCHTKQLQSQVVNDFPYAIELKGRSNYSCAKDPGSFPKLSANECTVEHRNCILCQYTECRLRDKENTDGDCPCISNCAYREQKKLAKNSDLVILNTAYFLAEANFAGDFSGWPWIVLDEGDETESAIMSFVQVSITQRQINRLNLGPPAKKTVAEAWVEWMEAKALPAISQLLGSLDPAIPQNQKEIKAMERLAHQYSYLASQDLSQWAFIPGETSWDFKPVFIASFAEHNLWRHADRFLVMSATILSAKHFARHLGLKEKEVEMIDLPSPFPVDTRPVLFCPAAQMTHKNREAAWPEVVRAMDDILDNHPTEKGLIHSVSYALTRYVYENSNHRPRFLQHDTRNRTETLEKFKSTPGNDILLSPSMERGVDLPGEQCRFIVILKIPAPNIGDAQIARRTYSTGKEGHIWYAMQTIRGLVQMSGRGVRFQGDYCICYILDFQLIRLYNEHRWLFPRWWLDAFQSLPRPDELERWRKRIAKYREPHEESL